MRHLGRNRRFIDAWRGLLRMMLLVLLLTVMTSCRKAVDTSVAEARKAKDDTCACANVDCKAEAQQRFATARSRIADSAVSNSLTAEMSACLPPEPGPWDRLVADACQCKTPECAADIERRVRIIAPPSDEKAMDRYADELAACLEEYDEGILALSRIRDNACACADVACLEQIQKDLAAAANLRTRDMDRATQIAGEISECVQKLAP
jgi:hypothetical protein